jgi:hypothetical protein
MEEEVQEEEEVQLTPNKKQNLSIYASKQHTYQWGFFLSPSGTI